MGRDSAYKKLEPNKYTSGSMILASTIDKHGMSISDELKLDINYIISSEKPSKIIETGTYLGLGSTKTILESIILNDIEDASFTSIEANKVFYLTAKKHLKEFEHMKGFRLINSISIPRILIPKEVENDLPENVITDHLVADDYLKETDFDCPYDGLGFAMGLIGNRPDLVILDSAGHLGTIEFHYLMSLVDSSFILILDDTLHRKHFKTMEYIRSDERFTILKESKNKFGYAICKYENQ